MSLFQVKNISVETAQKKVVDDINFSVRSGEIHVLMGPNGSGKSSFLNALLSHPAYTISGGVISLDDEDITNLATEKKAKKGLFLSMQYLPEVPGVTLESFLYRAYKELTGSDMSIIDFHAYAQRIAREFDINTEFLSRELNVGFSGGEKKQSEILQLAILKPKFAFLDEIDSGVDVDSLNKVFNGIVKLSQEGTGFLLVTHYTNILSKITPDAVHVMKDGRLVASGEKELVEKIEQRGFQDLFVE